MACPSRVEKICAPMIEASEAKSLFHDVESNGMGIVIQRGREQRRDDGHYLVPIEVRIPIGAITLLPQEQQIRQARLKVFVAAMDEKGGMSEVQESIVPCWRTSCGP